MAKDHSWCASWPGGIGLVPQAIYYKISKAFCYDKPVQENYIRRIKIDEADTASYPLIFLQSDTLKKYFESPVTFFVGENGTGKSTPIEAIAVSQGSAPGLWHQELSLRFGEFDIITFRQYYPCSRLQARKLRAMARRKFVQRHEVDAGTFDQHGIHPDLNGKRIHEQYVTNQRGDFRVTYCWC